MLWTLLVAISSVSLCSAAVIGGSGAGLTGNVTGLVIGLPLAIANAIGWTRLADAITRRIQYLPAKAQERRLAALYLFAWCWGWAAAAIGYWLTGAVLQLF